jgi:hypothetical protein
MMHVSSIRDTARRNALLEKKDECTMYRLFKFLRYARFSDLYAFQIQFHPGVCRPPAAKKTTV